jgi:hypothetical protein
VGKPSSWNVPSCAVKSTSAAVPVKPLQYANSSRTSMGRGQGNRASNAAISASESPGSKSIVAGSPSSSVKVLRQASRISSIGVTTLPFCTVK